MTQAPALYLNGRASIGGAPLFETIELTVPAGEWTCLLGASGVGKSSILKLFTDAFDHITFEGTCTASAPFTLPDCCTLMAQDDLLFPWLSILDNIQIGSKLRGESAQLPKANNILKRVGLSELATRKPHELSGGQRQRAALARTLMEDRPVVLLDEPFSALDALTRANMQDLTAELLHGKTVLLITHDPNEAARLAHHCHIMTKERLIPCPMPKNATPRPVDDAEVLATQGELLTKLRGHV